jgi:predicted acyl esterase
VVRGWLRFSLRTLSQKKSAFDGIIPVRDYLSTDVKPVALDTVYTEDIEIWPTSVVLLPGERLALQVSSGDSEGVSLFEHNHPEDRSEAKIKGHNDIHVGPGYENYLELPIIPSN